jgi:uncharacterized membrane protein
VSATYRYAAFGIFALLMLQLLWHGYLFPPASAPMWLICAMFVLPIVPAAVMAVRRHRHAPFWGAVAALLYFSHGLMEAWATPDVRWLALVEAALSVWLIVAASWNGLKARFNKTKASPPAI